MCISSQFFFQVYVSTYGFFGVAVGERKSATQGERGALREDGGDPAQQTGGAGVAVK